MTGGRMSEKKFYRVSTVSKMFDVSKSTIWALIKKGTFTRIKISDQITVVDADEVNQWVESKTKKLNQLA